MPAKYNSRAMRFLTAALLLLSLPVLAQNRFLDPSRGDAHLVLERDVHQPLPEQYIWVAGATGAELATDLAAHEKDVAATRYFRTAFEVSTPPHVATLYIAGPNQVRAFLNGKQIADATWDPKSKIRPFVVVLDVTKGLQAGRNVLAIEASHFHGGQGAKFGGHPPELVVKIVPAAEGVNAKPLLISGPGWRGSLSAASGWEQPGFDDASWHEVQLMGGMEADIDRFQWNDDAALYRWPGYDGISPFLGHIPLMAKDTQEVDPLAGKYGNIAGLTGGAGEFTVTLPPNSDKLPPNLILDFGREIDGRIAFASASDAPMKVNISYGESVEEAKNSPFLGDDEITIPARATAYGPKTAFRFAVVRFLSGPEPLRFKSIGADGIYYPVEYRGSFESSDPLLNRIWESGAYTSHLCMQDDIWDAPKRDRGRWMGDLDVSGRVIDNVFSDQFLMKETMDHLLADAGNPVSQHVDTIPGYSAFWVMGEADYYRYLGDRQYLDGLHDGLVQLLAFMAEDINEQGLFANEHKGWPFIDWSPGLAGDTPDARIGNQFEFYKAFHDGAWMLTEMGDSANAAKYEALAGKVKAAAGRDLFDARTGAFGTRWQPNAMAIFSGAANQAQRAAIWNNVLSKPSSEIISPYYNFYVIEAMAESGHRREALDWIRRYWGGMINEGATSLWESYDPSWPKQDFHRHLQADNNEGYFVSLSHGWSSGPTAWLMEEVLGIQPLAPGFARVSIRPDLIDLSYARGGVPTPHGPITVDYRGAQKLNANITLPAGVQAEVSFPVSVRAAVMVNGRAMQGKSSEEGTRSVLTLQGPGRFALSQ
ncbi:MAG: alpha-L-rhamnosidase C-terminal domain-containing protein [Terriglobales bacterium]